MPRGTHPNSLANLKKGKKTQFNGETAAKAGKKGAAVSNPVQKQNKTIQQFAKIINSSPAQSGREVLQKLGIKEEDMTNAALIAAAVFRAAFEGDMKAVEKWESYVNEGKEESKDDDGFLAALNGKAAEIWADGDDNEQKDSVV